MDLKTPLYETHVALKGKIVPFGGYLLPVQFPSGVIAEHTAVRTHAGLFDVSHMGEVFYEGKDTLKNLNYVLTNDFTNLADGRVRYSLMCNERGGVVDDLIVYRFHEEKYMVVVNASNKEKDVEWMRDKLFGDVRFYDASAQIAQIALQGPAAEAILRKLTAEIPQKYYSFLETAEVCGIDCLVSRTGYTGEAGFELYTASVNAEKLWEVLMKAGEADGLIPCGLGARDTLRLEASMPLYGHELSDEITPFEAGLGFAVKMEKDFIGKDALKAAGEPKRLRVGLKITGKGIVREHQTIYADGEIVGETTSGTFCPTLGGSYAMGYVKREFAAVGTKLAVDVRGRKIEAEVVLLPFYKRA